LTQSRSFSTTETSPPKAKLTLGSPRVTLELARLVQPADLLLRADDRVVELE
jgi:hypothetical protein